MASERSLSASPEKSRAVLSPRSGRPKWKRMDGVLSFPSSKRVQGAPSGFQNPRPHKKRTGQVSSSKPVWTTRDRLSNEDPELCGAPFKRQFPHLLPSEVCADDSMDVEVKDAADDDNDTSALIVDVSQKFLVSDAPRVAKEQPVETDPHKLNQRQKQIDYGKNTLGYERYLELVSRNKRQKKDPNTPEIKQVCSKRSWDGQVKKWRRRLHEFDPPAQDGEEKPVLISKKDGTGSEVMEDDGEDVESKDADSKSRDSESLKEDDDSIFHIYNDFAEFMENED